MTEQKPGEIYLSVEEAMQYLGVSRRSLERYVEQGKLTRYKRQIARRTFFKQSELDSLKEIRPEEGE